MVLLCALTQVTLSIRIYEVVERTVRLWLESEQWRGGPETFNRTEMDVES